MTIWRDAFADALGLLACVGLACGVAYACTPAERAELARDAPTPAEIAKSWACVQRVSELCAADAGLPCTREIKAAALASCVREPLVILGACATPAGAFDTACVGAAGAAGAP